MLKTRHEAFYLASVRANLCRSVCFFVHYSLGPNFPQICYFRHNRYTKWTNSLWQYNSQSRPVTLKRTSQPSYKFNDCLLARFIPLVNINVYTTGLFSLIMFFSGVEHKWTYAIYSLRICDVKIRIAFEFAGTAVLVFRRVQFSEWPNRHY